MQEYADHMYAGIEIGGTKLQVLLGTSSGRIKQHLRYAVRPDDGAAGIQAQIAEAIHALQAQLPITAIGVGFGGPVDWRTGVIQLSHQVEGWAGFHLKSWLEKMSGVPVVVDNDANVAALAEAVHGGNHYHNTVFYMTIGSGIGGGLISNGHIYHGRPPGEVEIGHIRLDKNGSTLESRCSGWAVNKKIITYIQNHPDSLLAALAENSTAPEATLLQPALEKGDKAAQQIVEDIADDIAFALSHAVHLFHPDSIIIGGGLSLLGEGLQLPVTARLPHYVMKAFLPPPVVELASLGENVVPIGALELAKAAMPDPKKNNSL